MESLDNIQLSSTNPDDMKEFFIDFIAAQGQLKNVLADTDMQNKFQYAELSQVISAIRKPFQDNGIGIIQMPNGKNVESVSFSYLTTMLIHKSGHWLKATMILPVGDANRETSYAQLVGAAISYCRRYMILSMAGIAQVEDESDLIPDFDLAVSNGSLDIEEFKENALEIARSGGMNAINDWYENLKPQVKKFLSETDDGKSIMQDIRAVDLNSNNEEFVI